MRAQIKDGCEKHKEMRVRRLWGEVLHEDNPYVVTKKSAKLCKMLSKQLK